MKILYEFNIHITNFGISFNLINFLNFRLQANDFSRSKETEYLLFSKMLNSKYGSNKDEIVKNKKKFNVSKFFIY